jgi:hypothetical protein
MIGVFVIKIVGGVVIVMINQLYYYGMECLGDDIVIIVIATINIRNFERSLLSCSPYHIIAIVLSKLRRNRK